MHKNSNSKECTYFSERIDLFQEWILFGFSSIKFDKQIFILDANI